METVQAVATKLLGLCPACERTLVLTLRLELEPYEEDLDVIREGKSEELTVKTTVIGAQIEHDCIPPTRRPHPYLSRG